MNNIYARSARVLLGILGLSSIFLEMIVLSSEGVFNSTNFFSFFTILSNLFAATYLIYFGLSNSYLFKSQILRGGITLYMLMTGVIFAFLLSGLENIRLTAVPWDNLVLHYFMPIVMVGDWLLNPPKKSLPRKVVVLWIIFPMIYVTYTLIRGTITNWYPYPFLNPLKSSYTEVAIISVIIAFFVTIAAFGLRSYINYRSK